MESETRKLYRSRSDRIIGGVCGGLGDYFSLDPTLVRVLYVLFALTFGSGLLVYLIMLFLIPQEPLREESPPAEIED